MSDSNYSEDQIIFCISDLRRLFFRYRKKLLLIAVFSVVFLCLFYSRNPPKYLVKATFQEEEFDYDKSSNIMNLFSNLSSSKPSKAKNIMISQNVIQQVVKKLGLQVQITDYKNNKGFFHNFFEHIKVAIGKKLKDADCFVVEDVETEYEEDLTFYLHFINKDKFEVLNSKHKNLGSFFINQPVELKGIKFLLKEVPHNLKANKLYVLNVSPLISTIETLIKKIKIITMKGNNSVLKLSFQHRDRHFATKILNSLMLEYELFIKKSYEKMAQEQLVYLRKRQNEINNNFAICLQEHAKYSEKFAFDSGFFTSQEALKFYQKPLYELKQSLINYELKLSELQSCFDEKDLLSYREHSKEENEIVKEMDHLKLEKSKLTIVLNDGVSRPVELEQRLENINEIQKEKSLYLDLVNRISKDQSFQELYNSNEVNQSLKQWLMIFSKLSNDNLEKERPKLISYLEDQIQLLNIKEDLFSQNQITSYFHDGMELKGVDKLLMQYDEQLDTEKLKKKEIGEVLEQLDKGQKDIGNLNTFALDNISQEIIQRANLLNYQLHDENHSQKEKDRILEEMSIQKSFLQNHLISFLEMKEIFLQLLTDKITSLREMKLVKVDQGLSFLSNNLEKLRKRELDNISVNRNICINAIKDLENKIYRLPTILTGEKLHQFQEKMALKIAQTITQLIEGKSIDFQLHKFSSKPIDLAYAPLCPTNNYFFLAVILVSCFSFFLSYFIIICIYCVKGFPLSVDLLKVMKKFVYGELSNFCSSKQIELLSDKNLDVLRKIRVEVQKNKIIALIGKHEPNYSHSLAAVIAKERKKVLLIDCSFPPIHLATTPPGLLQYLKGETKKINVQHEEYYDYIVSGGSDRFSLELLSSNQFSDMLESFSNCYDNILLYGQYSINCFQTKILAKASDHSIFSVKTETVYDMQEWSLLHNLNKSSFVVVK